MSESMSEPHEVPSGPRRDLLGILVFTPSAFLEPNATYTASLDAAADPAGNRVPLLPQTRAFDTLAVNGGSAMR